MEWKPTLMIKQEKVHKSFDQSSVKYLLSNQFRNRRVKNKIIMNLIWQVVAKTIDTTLDTISKDEEIKYSRFYSILHDTIYYVVSKINKLRFFEDTCACMFLIHIMVNDTKNEKVINICENRIKKWIFDNNNTILQTFIKILNKIITTYENTIKELCIKYKVKIPDL